MTPDEFDAAALAIIRPSWPDRERYGTPEAQVRALRGLAEAFADERAAWRIEQMCREERWPAATAGTLKTGTRSC
jgi:hypothetical protein